MDESAVRESRRLLRQVHEHIFQIHLELGARQESVGMVDVVSHPSLALPELNYVTPRRNTAWIAGQFIQQGVTRLSALGRKPRTLYIEGLFLPEFGNMLTALGLALERKTAILVRALSGESAPALPPLPCAGRAGLLRYADGDAGAFWRDAGAFNVHTLAVEPLVLAPADGRQFDVVYERGETLLGMARLSITARSAHVVALAVRQDARPLGVLHRLLVAAARAALDRGCALVFAPGDDAEITRVGTKLGFMDFGSIVCYAARDDTTARENAHDGVGQPVLSLR